MKNLYSTIAKKITPYSWSFGDGMRFNSNTLPYSPPSLKKFLSDMVDRCPINEYADPTYKDLKELVSEYEAVSSDMITVTNSGDEAIDVIAKTFLNPGDVFITAPPTYEMFALQSEINKGISFEIPLRSPDYSLDIDGLIQNSKRPEVKLMFLCNPNNPTGNVTSNETLENIIRESQCIVVVDEVYREFYGQTAVPLLQKYSNLVVLRSFSKFAGLAGARIGYLLASADISQKFYGLRFPMGVSYFSYKLAEYVLRYDQEWIRQQIQMIRKERTRLSTELTKRGFFVYPSQANFLLVKFGRQTKNILKALEEKNILIRDRTTKPYLEGCVRITVRSRRENDILLNGI